MKYLCHWFGMSSADICPFIHVPRRTFPCVLPVWMCIGSFSGLAEAARLSSVLSCSVMCPQSCGTAQMRRGPHGSVQDATAVLMLLHDSSLAHSRGSGRVSTVILCGSAQPQGDECPPLGGRLDGAELCSAHS